MTKIYKPFVNLIKKLDLRSPSFNFELNDTVVPVVILADSDVDQVAQSSSTGAATSTFQGVTAVSNSPGMYFASGLWTMEGGVAASPIPSLYYSATTSVVSFIELFILNIPATLVTTPRLIYPFSFYYFVPFDFTLFFVDENGTGTAYLSMVNQKIR